MEHAELIEHYPRLHHMAEAGSWPGIQQVGLMTTEQLVEACAPDEATQEAILKQRRPRSYTLQHPVLGPVTVRDQGPLKEHNLRPALTDMTVQEWLEVLNDRVFFWLHPDRLAKLLGAKLYRDATHDVLVLDTTELLAAHGDDVRLAGINTGATIFPNAPKRGSDTFTTVENFPFAERRKGRSLRDAAVELAVIGGVPDVSNFVLKVERRRGADVIDVLYERSAS
ncbi:DUF7002 family protein [Kribbella sp. CA-293567]|uniref:DUF7002 family protein n=1 Tax=Kribbella sp. CA-293567 TaxID=3002436 RepID=UPI0022DDD6F3|nr:hypothetical protein [Kribbella sp. CA-293567]WBQ04455.1 hypothetical protein OX958_31395 [Kribbella sp. CA-293567]